MAYTDARTVAEWFLCTARTAESEEGLSRRVSNKKLQKLVFYAQAWHLAIFDAPLFDDPIVAWIHGPVVPELYHEFKLFGYNPIEIPRNAIKPDFDGNGDITEHLQEVWDIYGKFSAQYLEALTHEEGPWQAARERMEDGVRNGDIISNDEMALFYRSLNEKAASDGGD